MNPIPLPSSIRSRIIEDINEGSLHILEAGDQSTHSKGLILLIHGFPELAFSWRKVMVPLASYGYHVIAPDVRGYGRSSNTGIDFFDDLGPFSTINKIQDMLHLVARLGYKTVASVIGHDQGASLAGWCALSRPDVFKSTVLMSTPFRGAPVSLPLGAPNIPKDPKEVNKIHDDLRLLNPPRKYYQQYFATKEANQEMWHPRQDLKSFLRAYYHFKSADWHDNKPFRLKALTASEWEKLPRYYVMDLNLGMSETVLPFMPTQEEINSCKWLTDRELDFYTEEYARTGFQGGLQGYRNNPLDKNLAIFSGKKIEVPSIFIGGEHDWGPYQNPGALENLETKLCEKYQGTHLIKNAGHWVQQEQPDATIQIIKSFIEK